VVTEADPDISIRKCLRTKICPKTILGQILVRSRVLENVEEKNA